MCSIENRHGLCVDLLSAPATGTVEWDTVPAILRRQDREGIRPTPVGAQGLSLPELLRVSRLRPLLMTA